MDDTIKAGLEAACDLQNWIEDNVSDDFFELIPVDMWNKITSAVMHARNMESAQ